MFDQLESLLRAITELAPDTVTNLEQMLPMIALWEKEADALDDIIAARNKWTTIKERALNLREPNLAQLSGIVSELTRVVAKHAPLLVEQLSELGHVSPILLDSLVACQRAADAAANAVKHGKLKQVAAADHRIN